MKKLQVAVIGLGSLGSACANALIDEAGMALAGIVRRPDSLRPLAGRLADFPAVGHVRDLPAVDVALVCVPAYHVLGVARELLQAHVPVVECARLEGRALDEHYVEIDSAAKNHRATAVVGAGWSPGVLPLFTKAFEMLIPHGRNVFHRHPGVSLHHSAAVERMSGVKEALAGEYHGADGALQRYVYVVLERGADFDGVQAAVTADPLFAGEETRVFHVNSLTELEAEESQGMVLERRSATSSDSHASLLIEARFKLAAFASRVMLDAARTISLLPHGAHRYTLGI
ncbi:MAG TPA: NAD(P)-binding domain-containing protein [Burkholderiaceae bacterium]|nr:NAD(P)-binding domain-containing protein [Burkholderiaceae bacterium]